MSAQTTWDDIRTVAKSRRAGMNHFASAARDAQRLWLAFANYARQAYSYFEGGQAVPGTSSALLYYYMALQLAKAELLTTNATDILGKALKHGLVHHINVAAHPRNDFLEVANAGAFPMLYRKRFGENIPAQTKLRIPVLLDYIPEIARETSLALGRSLRPMYTYHSLFGDGNNTWWTAFLFPDPGFLIAKRKDRNAREFHKQFEAVELLNEWKTLFGVSSSRAMSNPQMYQSRSTAGSMPDGSIEIDQLYNPIATLSVSFEPVIHGQADALFAPTLPGSTIRMTPSLARYALMYYLSSLVRYKPVVLDPTRYHDFAHVFESFCSWAALPLVSSASDAITNSWHTFGTTGRV